jgi:hypothetical protein
MIFLLTILIAIVTHSCTPVCPNYFPKNIGGNVRNTHLMDFDSNHDTIFTCGYTYDPGLSGYPMDFNEEPPLITASDIYSNQIKWGFTD